ncbi:B12-binding domain-containing radical SAM protein [Candidatus Clostridium helianthi]|uniref:B12-binding domain-containing radical SAM protein n=1 Tax=Candidatus Clostridium helianthi TaxID=3381660 RepID=A0ABW8S6R1_9CLOT
MDIIIAQFPNKTIEIAPLGSSILIGSLRQRGYSAKQYDLNIVLKDELLKSVNLYNLYNKFLPELLKHDFTNSNYNVLKSFYRILDSIEKKHSIERIEFVKELLQRRKYIEVFQDETNTKIFESMLNILTISNKFFEIIILNDVIEKDFKDIFVYRVVDKYLQEFCDINPKIIGFSTVQMQRKFTLWAAKRLKVKFNFKGNVMIGGSDVTYYKEKYLKYFDYVDFAIYQEGELAIEKLIDYIDNTCKLEDVPNLIYRKGHEIVCNKSITPHDFDKIIPDFDDLDLDKYITNALPMQVSRGCSWGKCTYCKHFRTYGEKYYFGDINNIVDIIEVLVKKYSTNLFHFVDDDFPKPLKNKFCDEIIDRKLDIRWLTYSRLDKGICKEDLEKWFKAGLRVIEWGLESASQKVLNSVNKGINIENIKRLLFEANNIGFLNKLFMFHNLPEEDYDDLYESILFLKKFVRHKIVRPFWEISTPLELLEGTPLYEESLVNSVFKKVYLSRGELLSKASYIHKKDYRIKKDIFNKEFDGVEEFYKKQGVLNVNDEAIMFDVIIDELSNKHKLYAKVRL